MQQGKDVPSSPLCRTRLEVLTSIISQKKVRGWRGKGIEDFTGGPVVKNLPATAGDTGSILGAGRFHLLQSN